MALNNKDLQAPTHVAIVQSDTVDQGNTLRGIEIWAEGTISAVTTMGYTIPTRTITAAMLPFKWVGQFKRINDTGTTIADGDMSGLR